MENFLNYLPIVFIYWACGLIVWSAIICAMQVKIIMASRATRHYTRRSDTVILITAAMGAICLFIATFVVPMISVLFVEVCLLMSLWYTVFLMLINHLNIVCWVKYCKTNTLDWTLFPILCITSKQRSRIVPVIRHSTPTLK